MKFLHTAIVSIVLLASVSFAQAPDTLWTRTYGGTTEDHASSVMQTADSGYIIGGTTSSFGAGLSDFFVVKATEDGNVEWTQTYGGSSYEESFEVCQTLDGGYVIAGSTRSFGAGGDDFYVVKTDAAGNSLWTRTYGGSQGENAWTIQQTIDGGYIISGRTNSFGAGNWDIFVVRTNSNGDAIWTRTYGGSNADWADDLKATSDGGFIFAGRTMSFGNGSGDFYLVKSDSLGVIEWSRTYGGTADERAFSVQQTADGGYLIAGETFSFGQGVDCYVVKTDADGDTLWTRNYGGNADDWASSIQQTTDGGHLIAGQTGSFGAGGNDFYILRTDAQGDTLWTRVHGGSATEYAFSIQQTTDGGYIVAGWTTSFGAGSWDFYVVRTGPFRRVNVQYPNSFGQIPIFSTDTISWTGVGFDGGVSIELNRHYPIGAWETITESTENDGVFEWFVTDPLSDSCRIRICALQDTFCDVSDGNFSIVSSQGYLGLIRLSAPSTPVTAWNTGNIECPNAASQTFRLKNFGSEPIVVFQPPEPLSTEFSRTTTCGSFFALAPGGISTCSLTVSFSPTIVELVQDTLRIQTDAVNGINGYVNIPLSGSQIRTPESPEIVLSTVGNNSVLRWDPVTQSIGHCDIDPPVYLVFFSENPDGPFWFHGGTMDTSYTHVLAVQYASEMFYHVYASNVTFELVSSLEDMWRGGKIKESELLNALNDLAERSVRSED